MRLFPRLRLGCLIPPLAIVLLFFIFVEWQLGPIQTEVARWNFSRLEKRIETQKQVRLADLQDGWDRVCLATPYCSAEYIPDAPASIQQACSTAGGDDSFALAYFKGYDLVDVETLLTGKDIVISEPCLLLTDDPVIFDGGAELKIQPREAPQP